MPWTRSVVNILMAVNIGVFVLCKTGAYWLYEFGVMRTDLVFHGQIWRLFTSQYLHDPSMLMHIFFNMFSLHFMGRPLESRWGNRKFFIIYTIGGLIGNLALIAAGLLNPAMFPPGRPALGASGCILALIGAVAVFYPTATVIVFMFPMQMRTFALLSTGYFVFNITNGGWNAGGDVCHLGGLAFGVLWATYGETGRFKLPGLSRILGGRGGGGVRRRSGPSLGPSPTEQAEVDRILSKVSREGPASLSAAERVTLHRATQRERELDRRYGRVDRL
jgi:membrane associated rhomboid family serine protease